jgi:hypothetical protein
MLKGMLRHEDTETATEKTKSQFHRGEKARSISRSLTRPENLREKYDFKAPRTTETTQRNGVNPNTVHLRILMRATMSILQTRRLARGRSGYLLIFRFTPRGVLRPRLLLTRSSKISFPTTPYLDIRSPAPQSGKSLCLKLLREISAYPAFARGADARTLMARLLTSDRILEIIKEDESFAHTPLLDNCHHTFSPSECQPLLALFNSSSDAISCYPSGSSDYYLFGPKLLPVKLRCLDPWPTAAFLSPGRCARLPGLSVAEF